MKKTLVVFAVLSAALVSNASYLYWQVASSDYADIANNLTDLSYAKIYASGDNSQYLSNYYIESDASTSSLGKNVSFNSGRTDVVAADVSSLGTPSSYSYYVELYNSSNQIIGYSTANQTIASGNNAWSNTGAITLANLATTAQTMAWHAGGYTAGVPEPTSAILMLFGAAFLGLKRKNRSLA